MISLVDKHREGGLWLRMGQDLGVDGYGCFMFLARLLLHAMLVGTLFILALASDGTSLPWAVIFVPLLAVIFVTLVWLVSDLLCKAPDLEERAIFLRGFIVFLLLICLAAATMASLLARGIELVSDSENVFENYPTVNLTTGAFERAWTHTSSSKFGDSTAYLQLAEGSPFEVDGGQSKRWLGLNFSSPNVRRVYDPATIYEHCYAETTDGIDELCEGGEGSIEVESNTVTRSSTGIYSGQTRYCNIADLNNDGLNQTCRAGASGQCKLYVRPETAMDSKSARETAYDILYGIESSGTGALCSNGCKYYGDGECDDGGWSSMYSVCSYGTDCTDCGKRSWNMKGFVSSIYYPSCGYFTDSVAATGIEGGFPQRFHAPWLRGERAVCQQKCNSQQLIEIYSSCGDDLDSKTSCLTPYGTAHAYYNATQDEGNSNSLGWCCNDWESEDSSSKAIGIEAVQWTSHKESDTVEECIQACLVQYYYDQAACSLIQYNEDTGQCERVLFRGDRLCSYNSSYGTDCSRNLDFVNADFGQTSGLPEPTSIVTTFGQKTEDPWNTVHVAPKQGAWTQRESSWTLHIVMTQGFAGSAPDSITVNSGMIVILAPFLCIPLILGMLTLCVCCSPLNCLPDVRITDEDICGWDYLVFKGPAYMNAQIHNFRLLLLAFAIAAASVYLFFCKAFLDNAPSWPVVFIPFWIVCALVLASTASLIRSVHLIFSTSWTSTHQRARFGLHSGSYQATSARARMLLYTFWLFATLLVPAVVSLILLVVRLGEIENYNVALAAQSTSSSTSSLAGAESAGITISAESTVYPFFIGFTLNLLGFVAYASTLIMLRLHSWRMSRLESLELSVRAQLRHHRAQEIAQLKIRFLDMSRTSEELIEILQMFVFKGRICAVSHEEVRDLGHAKLALLEASGQVCEVWTPAVAKEFGELLKYLLSSSGDWTIPSSPSSSEASQGARIRMRDLGYGGCFGWFPLLIMPGEIQRRMLLALQKDDRSTTADVASYGFVKFLSTKRRVAHAYSARFETNQQPNESDLIGPAAASSFDISSPAPGTESSLSRPLGETGHGTDTIQQTSLETLSWEDNQEEEDQDANYLRLAVV